MSTDALARAMMRAMREHAAPCVIDALEDALEAEVAREFDALTPEQQIAQINELKDAFALMDLAKRTGVRVDD